MKQSVRLEDWIFIKAQDATSASATGFLRGFVFGHPHIADGLTIRTSLILSMDEYTAQTANTVYILGRGLHAAAINEESAGFSQRFPAIQTSLNKIRYLAAIVTRPFKAA